MSNPILTVFDDAGNAIAIPAFPMVVEKAVDSFVTKASGRIPEYDHGYATTELTNVFTTSAVGAAN